jgi:hypothetical protein
MVGLMLLFAANKNRTIGDRPRLIAKIDNRDRPRLIATISSHSLTLTLTYVAPPSNYFPLSSKLSAGEDS